MRHQVKDASRKRSHAASHKHIAELRNGRISQHFLNIGLRDANRCRKQSGKSSDNSDNRHRLRRALENDVRSRHHVHAGRHHGGRVDQSRYRRGTFHRIRQPHIKRDLRRLACRTHHQQKGDRGQKSGAISLFRQRRDRLEQRGEVKRVEMLDDQEKRNQKPKVANPVDDECLLTCRCR